MVRNLFIIASIFLAIVYVESGAQATRHNGNLPVVTVGFVIDGPWSNNDEIASIFQKEILDITIGEYDIRFPEDKSIVADWTVDGIESAFEQMLNDNEVDIVLTLGVIASHQAVKRDRLPKPVFAPFIVDAHMQNVPSKDGTSGIKNLNYLTAISNIANDLEIFLEIVPFENIVFLINKPFWESLHECKSEMHGAEHLGLTFTQIPVSESAEEALKAIPENTEAVYLGVLPLLGQSEYEKLIAGLIKKRLPNFALTGIMDVERGAMAGVMTRQLFIRRARRIALNIQRILLGEKAEDLSISIARDERLVINMATARSIGVYPNWSILTEAELISTDREVVQRELTLFKAVREAITVNPELAASSHALTAGSQDIITARANLLPQLEISALGTFIDDDRAESSFGAQAEQSVSATGSLTQIIFSEPVWANLSIQGKFQKAREYQHEQLRLDIILNTATAYLDVLRTKTFEFIQRENLNLTRSNLELARIRQNIGISNPAEVYRWENRIASNRKAVIDANTRRNLAEIALNTILSRPIEEHFTTADIHYDDPNLYIGDYKNMGALDNPWSFRNFRDFMVEKALADSPELAALDASIEANNRRHSSSKMTYWLPSIALKAELTNNFYKGGAGSDFELDPSLPFPISQADDTDWSIGIKASLPIFSGGSRYAATRKISTELKELEKTRRFVTDIIEQRIRSALHLMGASYAGIKQSRDAAEAARKSLEMIVDAYTRGEASILDLIDAQNAALVSDQLAANTIYDFIIDYLNVERAVGSFDFLMPDDMREEHLQKMKEYFKQANMKLGNP